MIISLIVAVSENGVIVDMIVQKNTFGWNNSDSSAPGVVTGGSGPGHLNNTQEFTAETSADTASTIDFD